MNRSITLLLRMALGLTLLSAGLLVRAADADAVQSPGKRRDTIEKAKAFLATRSVAPVTADPFHSEAFALLVSGEHPTTQTPTVVVGPKSDKDILQAIGASLKPSGFFVMGGQPTLVFGQKRVKSGSSMTITFEGAEYTLEIVSVDRTNFTLRLNREEFTRPIK